LKEWKRVENLTRERFWRRKNEAMPGIEKIEEMIC